MESQNVLCGVCDDPLSLLPEWSPVLFQCQNGHWWSIGRLLERWLPAGRGQTQDVLQSWEHRWCAFQGRVRGALSSGHTFIAADLQEAAEQMRERIDQIRQVSVGDRSPLRLRPSVTPS
ncbi:MAG TPA: hypothetical protein VKW04_08660 [Planctomycetota bacterium]|nr:hypothetical protein [Planctomycetota bacterium]